VLDALRTVHPDPGWAIVRLVEPILHDGDRRPHASTPKPPAELVHLPDGRALIVVDPSVFKGLRGVSTIPLSDGRAFLAFDQGGGLADLEVAIIDRREMARAGTSERAHLAEVRDIVRAWRRDSQLMFRTRSIIVVEGAVGVERRPLATLEGADGHTRKGAPRPSRRAG
jgi:hypothetical protein